jgi:hypothetical protein
VEFSRDSEIELRHEGDSRDETDGFQLAEERVEAAAVRSSRERRERERERKRVLYHPV